MFIHFFETTYCQKKILDCLENLLYFYYSVILILKLFACYLETLFSTKIQIVFKKFQSEYNTPTTDVID